MDRAHIPDDEFQHLQVWNRSVRLENVQALLRRWRLVQTGALADLGCTEQLFPGQRKLLDFLGVASPKEVMSIADCATPLFGLDLRPTERVPAHDRQPDDALQSEAGEESFLALVTRQDAVRTHAEQARRVFGLTSAEATWLSRFGPGELYALGRDPSMVLRQAVDWDSFVATAAPQQARCV